MLKGKNTIRLTGLFILLVVVYVVIEFTEGQGRSQSFRETLVDIDIAKVTKVEISGPKGTTVLTEEEGSWSVEIAAGKAKPVRPGAVKTFLNTIQSIEPSRLASRSKDQWKDFQVDSAGTSVVVYEGDEKALDIILGRFGMEGQRSFYTYVRLGDEEDTYVANDFMKMSVSTRPEDFRNNNVLQLEKDSLTSIAFNYPDSAFTLVKSESQWQINNAPADSAHIVAYLNDLRRVTSRNFAEGTGSGSPLLKVTYYFTERDAVEVSLLEGDVIRSTMNQHEVFADSAVQAKIFKGPKYFQ